ncbi:MAG: hypothetical protein Q4Q22_08990 [Methanosphaera sp.]|nr:hypothetical protein [Methanosphaera sp.]
MKKAVTNDAFKPLICIYTAILSILIVAYLYSFNEANYNFLVIMYIFATLFYILAFYKFIEYRNLDFYPSYSAYSFPFVISLIATYNMYKIFNTTLLEYLLIIESVIAVFCVFYVLYQYLKNIYFKDFMQK